MKIGQIINYSGEFGNDDLVEFPDGLNLIQKGFCMLSEDVTGML